MGTLKLTPNYFNSYEAAYNSLKDKFGFSDEAWRDWAKKGELDQYIAVLSNTDKITDRQKFYSDYNYEFGDYKTKVAALYNETLANRDNIEIERSRYKRDDAGNIMLDANGAPIRETYTASDYDYYKSVIKEANDANYMKYLAQQERDRLDSLNVVAKIGHNIVGLGTEVLYGLTNQLDALANTFASIGSAVDAILKGEDVADAWVRTSSSTAGRWFEEAGVQDWIIDFEKRYTLLRDENGDYSGFGKYVGGVLSTLGQMLPSMFLGSAAGSTATIAGASANTANTIGRIASSVVFYAPMSTNAIRETYQEAAKNSASIPSAAIIANSVLKSTAQYGIEVLLSKILGGTLIDNLVFGRPVAGATGKTLLASAGKRLLHDFVNEGLEEVFQDTSDFLLNEAFSLLYKENFGDRTLTMQSLIDAFFIGGLASFAGSALNIIATKRESTDTILTDADGKIKYDSDGKPKFKKLSKLASWEYGLNLESFYKNFAELQKYGESLHTDIEQKKNGVSRLSSEKYSAAFTEMYAAYRMITSIYSEIGEERFMAANGLLTEVDKLIRDGKFTYFHAAKLSGNMMQHVEFARAFAPMIAVEKLEKKLKEAQMTKTKEVVDKNTNLDELQVSNDVKKTIDTLLASDPAMQKVILTEDGNSIVLESGLMFIPIKYAEKVDAATIYETVAEQTLVDSVMKGKYKGAPIYTIAKLYREVTGNDSASVEEAVYNLIFNDSFFRIALSTANIDMYKFVSSLIDIERAVVPQYLRDAVYKQKLTTVIANMKKSLIEYLCNQQFADEKLDIFTKEELHKIAATRWCKDLYNRVITSKFEADLSEEDWKVLQNRVNSMPLPQSQKDIIWRNLHSHSENTRLAAMNRIAAVYKGAFTTLYDGKTYMPETSTPNKVFNTFLRNNGLTIETLLSEQLDKSVRDSIVLMYGSYSTDSILKFRQSQFQRSCNDKYTFRYDSKGKLGIYEAETLTQVGFSQYYVQSNSLLQPTKLSDRTTIERSTKQNGEVKRLLNENIDAATAAYLSIDDVITDPSLLSDDIKAKIQLQYNDVSSESTFMYLRKHFIDTLQHTTVVALSDGSYAFADIRPMLSTLKEGDFVINKNTSITSLVNQKFLYGRLQNIKIKLTDDNILAQYDTLNNVIYINRILAERGGDMLKFAFLHEFQHAIQTENGMNIGISSKWITSTTIKKSVRNAIIKDVREHRPELFRGVERHSDKEAAIVNDFVYFSSGESTAIGIDASTLLNFYPTIVKYSLADGTSIQFPWGKTYAIGNTMPMSLQIKTLIGKYVELLNDKHIFELMKPRPNIASYDGLKELQQIYDNDDAFINWRNGVTPIRNCVYQPIGVNVITTDIKKNALDALRQHKNFTLHELYKHLRFNISFEEFLETPLPVYRIQTPAHIHDDHFVSCMCAGDVEHLYDSVYNYLLSEMPRHDSTYNLFYGYIKPKDMYGYIAPGLTEVLIPTNIAQTFDKIQISMLTDKLTAYPQTESSDTISLTTPAVYTYTDYKYTDYVNIISDYYSQLDLSNTKLKINDRLFKQLHLLNDAYNIGVKSMYDIGIAYTSQINVHTQNSYGNFDTTGNSDYTADLFLTRSDEIVENLLKSDYVTASRNSFVELLKLNNIDVSSKLLVCIPNDVSTTYAPGYIILNEDMLRRAASGTSDVGARFCLCSISDIDLIHCSTYPTCNILSKNLDRFTDTLLMPITHADWTETAAPYFELLDNNANPVKHDTNDVEKHTSLGDVDDTLNKQSLKIESEGDARLIASIQSYYDEILKQTPDISNQKLLSMLSKQYPFSPEDVLGSVIKVLQDGDADALDKLNSSLVGKVEKASVKTPPHRGDTKPSLHKFAEKLLKVAKKQNDVEHAILYNSYDEKDSGVITGKRTKISKSDISKYYDEQYDTILHFHPERTIANLSYEDIVDTYSDKKFKFRYVGVVTENGNVQTIDLNKITPKQFNKFKQILDSNNYADSAHDEMYDAVLQGSTVNKILASSNAAKALTASIRTNTTLTGNEPKSTAAEIIKTVQANVSDSISFDELMTTLTQACIDKFNKQMGYKIANGIESYLIRSLDLFTVLDSSAKTILRNRLAEADISPDDVLVETAVPSKTKKRYVSQKRSVGTNMEKYGYTAKYKRTQMSPELQHFINNATSKIAAPLWNALTSGKLQYGNIIDYFVNADTMNEATFDLINDSFFHNTKITSFKALEQFISDTPKYNAMNGILKSLGKRDALASNVNPTLLQDFEKAIADDSDLSSLYDELKSKYYTYHGFAIDVSDKNLRRLWMQYYDGSAARAGYIATIAKYGAVHHWQSTGDQHSKEVRLNEAIANSAEASDAFEEIFNSTSRREKVDEIMKLNSQKYILKLMQKGRTARQISDVLAKKREQFMNMSESEFNKSYAKIVKNMTDEEITALFAKQLVATSIGIDVSKMSAEQASELTDATNFVLPMKQRPSSAIVNNIRSIIRTIKLNLSAKERASFCKENSDIFTEDLSIKDELITETKSNAKTKYRSAEQLLPIEDRVRELSKAIRSGKYSSKKAAKLHASMSKEIARLEKQIGTLQKELNNANETIKQFEIRDDVISVSTDLELPAALERILASSFTSIRESKIQDKLEGDKEYMSTNIRQFIAENAELLNTLSQSDVDEIVEYYLNSEIIPSTNKARQYAAVQLYMMTFLIRGNRIGQFTLTEEQSLALNKRARSMVSISAQVLANWKSAQSILDPAEIIVQSMAKSCDIVFAAEDVKDMIDAIHAGDIKQIEAVKKKMYEEGLKQHKGKKSSFLDRIIKFERMFMLSGPGTWVRNYVSNALVYGGNLASEHIGAGVSSLIEKLFPKGKWKRDKQYKIVGTKVSKEIQTFIKTEIIDSGLLELVRNGLSKYDAQASKVDYFTENEILAQLVTQSVKTEIFQADAFKAEWLNKTQNFIMSMLSDEKPIAKATIKYLGKMLAEDNVDVSKGVTKEIIEYFAEAFKLASYDYMHTSNFFNKLESLIRRETGNVWYFAYKQILPFASASWNWFMEGLNYTPVGLIKGIFNFVTLENTIAAMDKKRDTSKWTTHDPTAPSSRFASYLAKRNIGKGVIGSIGLGIGIALAALGFAGIDEEDDNYKLFVHIGDERISVDISDLFGTQGIMLGIALASSFKGGDIITAISETLDTMFLDSTFTSFYNSFRYVESFGEWLVEQPFSFLQMLIPNFFKTLSSVVNKYKVKYSKGILGKFEQLAVQALPLVAYLFPKQIDPYTGENQVMYKAWFGTQLLNKLSPVKIYPYNVSDAEKEAISLGLRKAKLSGNYEINGEKLSISSADNEAVNEYYGKLNKTMLAQLIDNKTAYRVWDEKKSEYVDIKYNKMTNEQKKTVIERIMNDNSQIAKIYILTSNYNYKYYTTNSEYDKLKKLGIKNVYRKTNKLEGFVKN